MRRLICSLMCVNRGQSLCVSTDTKGLSPVDTLDTRKEVQGSEGISKKACQG